MQLRIGFDIGFNVPARTPIVLMLYVDPSEQHRLRHEQYLAIEPALDVTTYTDCFGNLCGRILAPPGALSIRYDNVVNDTGLPEPVFPDATQALVEDLPAETLQFLLPSRYCEVDRMSDIAWNLFGATQPGWARVQTICDWVHQHVQFGYHFASSTKTAWNVYEERAGVCRDYMHLAITLCRAMNIPARYATGYLSAIGEAPSDAPMDFSAFFEVYLGGMWHPFDARNNERKIGRVLMARGRDAADVALTTSFGEANLTTFQVWTHEVEGTDA